MESKRSKAKRLLYEIDNDGYMLSTWELNFIDDMLLRSERSDFSVTGRQLSLIERIYADRCTAEGQQPQGE